MPEGHVTHRLARALTAEFGSRPVQVTSPQGRFAEAAESLRQGIALLRERGRTHDTEPPRRSQAALHLRRAEMLRRAGVDATDDLTIARGLVDEMGWVVGKALYEAEEAERAELFGEAADLLVHLEMLLVASGASLEDAVRVLRERHAKKTRERG